MEETHRNSLLEELRTILLWEYLGFGANDHDGRLARQLRLEEIAEELKNSIASKNKRTCQR